MKNMLQQHMAAIAAAMVVGGAGAQAAELAAVTVPAGASQGVKEVVATAWPKAVKACPGLAKYAGDLAFAGVEDNFNYAPKHAQRIDVKFRVAEQPARVPASLRAAGHTCYFSLTRQTAAS